MWQITRKNMFWLLMILSIICNVRCWDNEELELFDLVEEVNQNFYDVMGVDQSASSSDIRRAYRKLSLTLHPDKNKEEGAETRFRQLVAIYEILKDSERRQQYDNVLVNGMPDWRQPVFYYRRVRKMGLIELALLLFLIFTVGHFIVMWASYLEKRFVMEEVFKDRKKKKPKKGRKAKQVQEDDDEEILQEGLESIPRPTLTDILPCKFVKTSVWLVVSIPRWVREFKEMRERRKEAERMLMEEIQRREEEIREAEERAKKPKPRKRVELPPEKQDNVEGESPVVYQKIVNTEEWNMEAEKQQKKQGSWSDEEMVLLAKAFAKFPGGALNRWEKIAAYVNRPVSDVIAKSKEIKGGFNKHVDAAAQGITGALNDPTLQMKKGNSPSDLIISTRDSLSTEPLKTTSKVDNKACNGETKGGSGDKDKSGEVVWTQNEQKAFEKALAAFPKGTAERWEKIAEQIPGKNKEDCIARFKFLADIVRKKKAQTS